MSAARFVSAARCVTVAWRMAMAGCFALVVTLVSAPSYAVAVTVEIASDVEELVDAPLARRLIRLELADVELPNVSGTAVSRQVPLRHGVTGSQRLPEEVVFVRLLRHGEGVVVELWACGELSGERRLVVASNEQHQARRVALASAELARRLREVRVAERQQHLRQHLAPNPETAPEYSTKVNVRGAGGVSAAMWPSAQATLIGPRLYLGVVTQSGIGVGVGGGVFASTAASVVRSWTEIDLRPNWQSKLTPRLEVAIGANLAAGVVDIEPNATFAGSASSHQTWQAKAGIDTRLEWLMSPRTALVLAPEAGVFLRKLRIERERTIETLDGVWFGFTLGARVYL